MRFSDTSFTAMAALKSNPVRSFLTMLGVMIGVGSVVLMTSIGTSMEQVILGQISSLGAQSMAIFPPDVEQDGWGTRPGYDSLTFGDIAAIEKLSTVENVAPIIFVPGTVSYGREEETSRVMATTATYFRNQKLSVLHGRFFDETEEGKSLAVLGPDSAENLFGNQDPIGKKIKVGQHSFTVIGIHRPVGTQFFQNADDRVIIPFKRGKLITGQTYTNFITLLASGDTDLARADITALLRQRHRISNPDNDPDKDDFNVRDAAQANEILGSVSLGLTLFMVAIASISLVVGGISIMNIMLVAVSERTREIGLRKAVGAKQADILFQFLTEAVVMTFLGGVIGVGVSIVMAVLLAQIVQGYLDEYVFALSLPSITLALFVAAATGLIFGIYPARRASQMHPIEALRYE